MPSSEVDKYLLMQTIKINLLIKDKPLKRTFNKEYFKELVTILFIREERKLGFLNTAFHYIINSQLKGVPAFMSSLTALPEKVALQPQ